MSKLFVLFLFFLIVSMQKPGYCAEKKQLMETSLGRVEFQNSMSSRCILTLKDSFGKNRSEIVLGGDGSEYFYQSCGSLKSSRVNFLDENELIFETYMFTSSNSFVAIRLIDVVNDALVDNELLSYKLTTCFHPGYSKNNDKYIDQLLVKRAVVNRLCNIDTGELILPKKIYLYDDKKQKTKSYLISNDRVTVEDYAFWNAKIVLLVNYKGKVRKWLKCEDLGLCL